MTTPSLGGTPRRRHRRPAQGGTSVAPMPDRPAAEPTRGELCAPAPAPARSTAEHLRSWTAEQRRLLFLARPDLAVPVPRDSAQLAARAGTRGSLLRALGDLDTRELAVLRVIASGTGETSAWAAALGLPSEDLDAALNRLARLALVWPGSDGWRPTGEVRQLLGPSPAGEPPRLSPPPLPTTKVDPERWDRSGVAAATAWVRHTEQLLHQWGDKPPVALRSSGLAVRDLKTAARLLQVTPKEAAVVIEVAAQARLIALAATEGVWLPSDAADRWLAESTAQRWLTLAWAWLRSPRLTHLVATGEREATSGRTAASTSRAANALAPELASPEQPLLRRAALRQLARAPEDEALSPGTGRAALLALLRWWRPRRFNGAERTGSLELQLAAALDESALIGLSVADRLTPWGRALVAGRPEDAVTALTARLPAPVERLLFQADLTAVAPGPLVPSVAAEVQVLADLESKGGADVFRFSAGSLRRAFDAGWSAADVHECLGRLAATPVPQPLTYLIDDVARSFGLLRVGYAEAFIRSDDEAALSRLLAAREAKTWGLRRIAPTVVVSTTPIETLLPRLRELGLAPVVEAPDGTVRVAAAEPRRARLTNPPPPTEAEEAAHAGVWAAKAAAAVEAGDRAARERTSEPTVTTAADAMAVVRAAIDAEGAVWLDYVDQHGQQSDRIVVPRRATSGAFVGWDERAAAERTYLWQRVRGVRLLDPGAD